MNIETLIPQKIPLQKSRVPDANVPGSRREREQLFRLVKQYVENLDYSPPIPTTELEYLAEKLLTQQSIDLRYKEYVGVLINNELWKETLASIPYNKRLLLLPKCLRIEEVCPAPFDEFGLLCKQCGLCSIQDLQNEAERLGYAVLVAEGSAVVTKLIESNKIEAIVGVSCLSVLKRTFPFMEMAAVPGIAIPLLQGDCKETNVDIEWLWDMIHLTSEDKTIRLDLDSIREEVSAWFENNSLIEIMGPEKNMTEKIARQWLSKGGKRWRPFLSTAVAHALNSQIILGNYPLDLKKCSVAVECFHKASLIHDDIEDDDSFRYGEKTLHCQEGIDVAINIGDFLIAEGYRLLSEVSVNDEIRGKMISCAIDGHRRLSLGQGEELIWRKNPGFIPKNQILEMFKQKTAPAFGVAIGLGALFGNTSAPVIETLAHFSNHLGVAYQVKDDLDDLKDQSEGSDIVSQRPSLVLSLCYEKGNEKQKKLLDDWWQGKTRSIGEINDLINELNVVHDLEELKESFKQGAINLLMNIQDPSLKGLLRRVVSKLFNDIVIQGWCNEFEATNASSSPSLIKEP